MSSPTDILAEWSGRSAEETREFLKTKDLEIDYRMVEASGYDGEALENNWRRR